MSFLRRNPFKSAEEPVAAAAAKPAAVKVKEAPVDDGRTAPEPLSIVLPTLAALGAVASISAVAWVAQDREGDRPRVKRRVDVILKDLETSCLGITEILKRVRRHARQLGLDGPQGAAPLKLGLSGGRVEQSGGEIYHRLINDLATMLVLATQNSFDAVNAIEDGDINASDAVLLGFAEAQDQLNRLLIQRCGARATIDGCLEVAQKLANLVRELKPFKQH